MTEDTRSRILASALQLIGQHGYTGMTIRHIADSLGLTKAAVHYHFAAKEQIALALMEPGFTALEQALDVPPLESDADRRALFLNFAHALVTFGSTMQILGSDPSIREVAGVEVRMRAHLGQFMALLEPTGEVVPRLRATAALGALQFGCMAATGLGKLKGLGLAPAVDDEDIARRVEVVVAGALAALNA